MNRSRPSTAGTSRPASSSRQPDSNSATITGSPKPPIPTKSLLRRCPSDSSLPLMALPPIRQGHAHNYSYETGQTAPPAYEWVPKASTLRDGEDGRPVEGEKLAVFRKSGGHHRPNAFKLRRRTCLIIGVAALLVIGLIVGLAVGLTVGRSKSNASDSSDAAGSQGTTSGSDTTGQLFPMGKYSMMTRLQTVNTSCTSLAETWNCYPYQVYNPANTATSDSSTATFTWVISNTSSKYAQIGAGSTSNKGEPANLTISSTSNPFSLTFDKTPLTYISPASNSSAARYTFSFDMDKAFNPPLSLSGSNVATQCFFNQTTFTGTLYLSAPRTFPGPDNSGSSPQWPYAIDIIQSSPGGSDVPACYEYVQGQLGARLDAGLVPQSAETTCVCEYRNY